MNDQWSKVSVALHWISAAVIIGLAVGGFFMMGVPADSSLRLLMSRLHTVFGMTLMVVTVFRLVARRGQAPEPLSLGALHRRGVAFVHGAMIAVLFGIGATGAITGFRSAWPSYLLGELGQVPDLRKLASRELHEVLVIALVSLVVLHIVGVVVQELRGGGALRRMLPRSRS